jgi:hypothetical protein
LFVAGAAYRLAVTAHDFDALCTTQLENILPGWLDVFSVGMALAVVSASVAHRRVAAPAGLDRRWAPPTCWALALVAFVIISFWIAQPQRCPLIYTFSEDIGIHYLYMAVAAFFLLPGHVWAPARRRNPPGAQTPGRGVHRPRVLRPVRLERDSHGEVPSLDDHYAFNTSFPVMLCVVFVAPTLVATISYLVVEKPVLSLKSGVPEQASERPAVT